MSTEQNQTTVDQVSIENIDDFLPMPGADVIVTAEEEEEKKTIFDAPNKPADLGFLDDDDSNVDASDVDKTFDELNKDLEEDDQDDQKKSNVGRKKTEKSGLVEFLKKRIESNEMFTFDDYDENKQTLDEYLGTLSEKDVEELWQANINNLKEEVASKTPKEFFESLPEELQYAAKYVADGGQDLKSLFKALAHVEEIRDLNPGEPEHQEIIVRQYLQATGFGNGDQDLIEDQIEEWIENGAISKKANQFKPKLDDLQSEMLQSRLAQQEQFKRQQQAQKEAYMQNIYETLKPGELNGVKIDNKRQKFLWDELTTVKYQSLTGRPTNLLGKLLEEYQFGDDKRYDLIAEATWLLSDPEDYKEHVKRQAKNEATESTVRSLKTEQSKKIASSQAYDDEETERKPAARKITRATNIFKR
jgi:hypothetical protein